MKGNDMSKSTPALINEMFARLRKHNTTFDAMLQETSHEYFTESVHSNWEGFTTREVRAIQIMLNDMSMYHVNK